MVTRGDDARLLPSLSVAVRRARQDRQVGFVQRGRPQLREPVAGESAEQHGCRRGAHVAEVIEAVGKPPGWLGTLSVLAYDEHGGYVGRGTVEEQLSCSMYELGYFWRLWLERQAKHGICARPLGLYSDALTRFIQLAFNDDLGLYLGICLWIVGHGYHG